MFIMRLLLSPKTIFKRYLSTAQLNIHSNSALKQKTDDFVKVEICGEDLQFPHVWLRDNCQCDKCFHSSAKSRIIDWSKFNVNVKPKDVVTSENSVQVTWDDGHKSHYELDWLKIRGFTEAHQKRYSEEIYKPAKITWNGDNFEQICSKHDYNEILKSDEALYEWLHNLSIYGVGLIKNTPHSETALDIIAEKIGFTKRTHYGVKFIVQHVTNTSNVAYLPNHLQMHIDLTYYDYCPGVNMLHCFVQTDSNGGENLLSDGNFVANYMKKHHSDDYKLLTDVEVEWNDVGVEHGKEFFKLHRSPVVCLDKHGQIKRINFSVAQRGSHFPGPLYCVKPWYQAHSLFLELSHRFSAKFKSKPGDILVFDNIRLLHGRNAYEDKSNNVRKLIGAYFDWDEVYSRLRCLKVKLENEDGITQGAQSYVEN